MATLHVSVCKGRLIAGANGGAQIIYDGTPIIAAALTTSGSASNTSTIATATTASKLQQGTLVARCAAVDAAHYVCVASASASATTGHYVASGSVIEIAIPPGAEISAVTA